MKLAIKQSGGHAGEVKDLLQLDTAQIEPSVSQQVERIIRDAKFFDLPTLCRETSAPTFCAMKLPLPIVAGSIR